MNNSIFQTLEKLGLSSKQSRVLFNERTRDVENLKVWKDSDSGVIYIDDFYTGNKTYVDGTYRDDKAVKLKNKKLDFERNLDAQRRLASNLKLVEGKKIADFGCGSGDFLKLVQPYCADVIGVELQQNYVDDHWGHILDIIQPVAKAHFGKQKDSEIPQYKIDMQQRLKLVKRRAELREKVPALSFPT